MQPVLAVSLYSQKLLVTQANFQTRTSACSMNNAQQGSPSFGLHASCIPGLVRGPQSQVVPEQLHDEGRVFVTLLGHVVKFCDGFFKRRPRHVTRLVWVAKNLVRKTEKLSARPKRIG